jgi:hypothetical protein
MRRKKKGLRPWLGADHPMGCTPSQEAYCEPGLAAVVMPLPPLKVLAKKCFGDVNQRSGVCGGGLTFGYVCGFY